MDSNLNTVGLLKDLKEDDHDSFKTLFDIYSPTLFRFSISYLKSQTIAEDVVQEVFIKVWENRQKIKTDTSFQSYIFTIALNIIRKHFNGISRLNELKHEILKDIHCMESDIDTYSRYQDLLDKLNEAISQMPEKRKAVFIKAKLEGKLQKEIAEELNISVKTVEYHIKEAMNFLKGEFQDIYTLYLPLLLFFY